MPFRPAIYQGRPYEEWLASQNKISFEELEERRKEQEAFYAKPHLVRTGGPVEFSTCKSLVSWPLIIWDVNNYYRDLGVSPHATVRELKEAYQKAHGYRSVRLTYILKQLLDKDIRREYDATQPGAVFYDYYVNEYVRDQMHLDEFREHGRTRTVDERLSMGDTKIDLSKYLNRAFNLDLDNALDRQLSSGWRWSYYQWCTAVTDPDKLRAWQQALVSVWGDPPVNLAVGLFENPSAAAYQLIGFRHVAFININAEPSLELAYSVYSQFTEREHENE